MGFIEGDTTKPGTIGHAMPEHSIKVRSFSSCSMITICVGEITFYCLGSNYSCDFFNSDVNGITTTNT